MIDHEGIIHAKRQLDAELEAIGDVPKITLKELSTEEFMAAIGKSREINRAYQRYSQRTKICHAPETDVTIRKVKKSEKST